MADRTIEIIRKVTPNRGVKIATVLTEGMAAAVIDRQVAKDLDAMRAIWGDKVQGPIRSNVSTKGLPGCRRTR